MSFQGISLPDSGDTVTPEADAGPGLAIPKANQPVLSPTAQQAFGNAVTYFLPGLGVGLLDTLGQSVGVLHDNTVPNILNNLSGGAPNSFGDVYSRDRAAFRAGGEFVGSFVPGLAAMKILKTVKLAREAGQLGEIAKGSKALDILLGNSADMTALETKISQEAITGSQAQGIWAGRTIATPAVNAAKRSYYASRALDAARTSVAFELGNRVAFNSSDTFYPADYTLTDQLKWAGIGMAGIVGLDLAGAKYAVRNLVQSALRTAATEPAAISASANPYAADVTNTIFRPNNRGVGITQYAALSQDLKDTAAVSPNATLKTNLAQDQTNIKGVLVSQIKAMAYDTHAILPRSTLDDGQLQLGLDALTKNNTTFLFAKKLSNVPVDGAQEFYKGIDKTLEKAKTAYNTEVFRISSVLPEAQHPAAIAKAEAVLKPIEDAANQIHYVIENDGSYSIYKNRADNFLDQNTFGAIKRSTYSTPVSIGGVMHNVRNSQLAIKADNTLILHDNFRMEIPAGATPLDFSALYAAGSKLIADYKPIEHQEFLLTPELNWRTIEGTLALADKHPDAMNKIKLGGGFSSIDDARFHVLNEKSKEFFALMPNTEMTTFGNDTPAQAVLRARSASSKANYTPAQVLQILNLPQPLGFQPSPLIETFAHIQLQGQKSLTEMFPAINDGLIPADHSAMDLLQAHLRDTAGITDAKQVIPTSGTLLNQKDIRPLFVAAESTPYVKPADANIAGRVQAMRDVQLERLSKISPQTSPLVSGVISKIVTDGAEGGELSGAGNQARAVQTLQDGLVSGQGQLVYQDRINDQFPTLKAAQLLAQNTDKFVDNYVATLASKSVTPQIAQILAPKNKADLLDFNRIEQAYRHGWEIEAVEPAPTGDGFVFRLKDTDANGNPNKINNELRSYHFGGDVEDEDGGHYLPDMSVTALKGGYTPLVVSKNAASLAKSISDMSRQSGIENNTLRNALGRTPITIRDFHLPTPELSRTGTWFVRNDTGNVIATYTGDLESSNAQRAKDAAQKLFDLTGTTHTAVPLDNVARDHAIFDDNFFNLIDYSDQLAKTGKGIKGGLARTEIDTGPVTLKAMVSSLQQQYLNIGVRARAAIFEPELNYARQAAQTTPRSALGGYNIFDRYISTMFSQTPNSSKGVIGGVYGSIETALDKSLSWLSQYHTELSGGEANTIAAKTAKTLLRKQSSAEEFNQFQKVLPEWNPLDDANKWAESTFREKMPWTTRPVMAKLSQVTSTMALRFLDVGMAINNFAGLATNSHSIVYALRKLPNESYETWISRTAAWGTKLTSDGPITFSPMKAMNTAIKAYWKGDLNNAMADAAKHGYFEPEYASLAKVLTTPVRSATGQKFNTFIDAASYLADHSEIMSRKLAWGMGYKIGKDLHGFTDDRNAYIFANNFVNDMIGNYSPNNKPAMFQGAVGLPLGAFQTYMFNFYRRLYGTVERGDKAALIAQYAAQASMFGARSVPGYSAWNSYMMSNDVGSDTFTDRTNKTFSPMTADLLLNGSLSSIPKIFGAGGLAFYSRGSVDMTQVPATILDIQKAPPFQFLAQTANGIQRTLDNIFSNESFSMQQQEEILATATTNRFLKSVMEMAANAKVDTHGAVVEAGTRDAIHVAAGLLGTQTSYARSLQDASNKERQVQLTQEALRSTLNEKTRALVRGGSFDISDIQGMVHDYTKSGGNPAYLGQWLRNTFSTAMTPKAEATMKELARSGKMLEFQDMLAAIQQNQNTPKTQGNN